jgi:hypothetical protein
MGCGGSKVNQETQAAVLAIFDDHSEAKSEVSAAPHRLRSAGDHHRESSKDNAQAPECIHGSMMGHRLMSDTTGEDGFDPRDSRMFYEPKWQAQLSQYTSRQETELHARAIPGIYPDADANGEIYYTHNVRICSIDPSYGELPDVDAETQVEIDALGELRGRHTIRDADVYTIRDADVHVQTIRDADVQTVHTTCDADVDIWSRESMMKHI